MSLIFEWLASPLIKFGLIGLILLGAVGYIDRRATWREQAKCQAAAMQAERDAALQDLRAEQQARERELATITTLEQEKGQADAAVESLKAELAKRPVSAQCRLSDDDVKRLR